MPTCLNAVFELNFNNEINLRLKGESTIFIQFSFSFYYYTQKHCILQAFFEIDSQYVQGLYFIFEVLFLRILLNLFKNDLLAMR